MVKISRTGSTPDLLLSIVTASTLALATAGADMVDAAEAGADLTTELDLTLV